MDRRTFFAGLAALSVGATVPLPRDQANAFILGFLFRFLIRTGLRRGLTSAALRSGVARGGLARATRGAPPRMNRSGRPIRGAKRLPSQPPKRVETGVGTRTLRNPESKNARQEFVAELGLELGLQMITPEEMGLDMPRVIGLSKQRAKQYQEHNADALWLTDEENSADLIVANLSSQQIVDLLDIELWSDRHPSGPLASHPFAVNAVQDSETLIKGPLYRGVPTGPLELQANPRNEDLLVSDYRGARIVGIERYELIQEVAG